MARIQINDLAVEKTLGKEELKGVVGGWGWNPFSFISSWFRPSYGLVGNSGSGLVGNSGAGLIGNSGAGFMPRYR